MSDIKQAFIDMATERYKHFHENRTMVTYGQLSSYDMFINDGLFKQPFNKDAKFSMLELTDKGKQLFEVVEALIHVTEL